MKCAVCALHCVIDLCGVCSRVALLDTVCMLLSIAEDSVSETFQLVSCGSCLYGIVCWSGWRQAVCSLSMPVFAPPFVYLKSLSTSCLMLNSSVLLFLFFIISLFLTLCQSRFPFVILCFDHVLIFLSLYFLCLHFHAFLRVIVLLIYLPSLLLPWFLSSLSNLGLGHCLLPPVLRWVLMLLYKLLFHSTRLHCSKIFSPGSVTVTE